MTKRRNTIAQDLRTPKYKPRVVKSKKKYTRRKKHQRRVDKMSYKKLSKQPYLEHGFWWWYDHTRKDWFVGCAPSVGIPLWAKEPG